MTEATITGRIEARFWSKVDRRGPDDCWPWTGPLTQGYGSFVIGGRTGQRVTAQRVAYRLLVGPIPDSMPLDHRCHSSDPSCPGGEGCLHRRCVNPAHLEPVTAQENMRRSNSPPAVNGRKGTCVHGHPFTAANTYWWRGHRACRICRAEIQRRRRVRSQKGDPVL